MKSLHTTIEQGEWKAETYKKWCATDLSKETEPWKGAVHQYFANEIIAPLLHQNTIDILEGVKGEIENKKGNSAKPLSHERIWNSALSSITTFIDQELAELKKTK